MLLSVPPVCWFEGVFGADVVLFSDVMGPGLFGVALLADGRGGVFC
jgi:hypothetical protein